MGILIDCRTLHTAGTRIRFRWKPDASFSPQPISPIYLSHSLVCLLCLYTYVYTYIFISLTLALDLSARNFYLKSTMSMPLLIFASQLRDPQVYYNLSPFYKAQLSMFLTFSWTLFSCTIYLYTYDNRFLRLLVNDQMICWIIKLYWKYKIYKCTKRKKIFFYLNIQF